MNRKGMSQVLALIVAASVLMMAGLTLVVLTQGGLSNFFEDQDRTECINSVTSTCSIAGSGTTHDLPAACERANLEGNDIEGASGTGDTYTCN